MVLHLNLLHVGLCTQLGRLNARVWAGALRGCFLLRFHDLVDLFLGLEDFRRVDVLRLQRFLEQLLRVEVDAINRVRACSQQIQERLILDVANQQGAGAACIDGEVAFDFLILVVQHVVVVVSTDVRLGHHVVELLDQTTQHDVGRVHQHLHAANRVRRCALLALRDGRHTGLGICQLGGHLDDAGQFGLMRIKFKRGECLAYVVHVVGRVPNLPRGQLPLFVGRTDDAGLDDDLRAGADACVVHHLAPCSV